MKVGIPLKKYAFLLFTYVATPLAMALIYFAAGKQYGQEWLFSSFIVFIFSIFLVLWRQFSQHAVGLIAMTAFTLLMLNSVLYLTPNEAATIYVTFMVGVLLVLYRKASTEGVVASLGLALLNITLHLPFANVIIAAIALAICALLCAIGWLKHGAIVKWLYTALTVVSALLLLLSL